MNPDTAYLADEDSFNAAAQTAIDAGMQVLVAGRAQYSTCHRSSVGWNASRYRRCWDQTRNVNC